MKKIERISLGAPTKKQFAKNLETWTSNVYSSRVAKAIYDYCKAVLPKEYKKAKFPLYRGLGLTESQLQKLSKTKRLKLRARLISSWTESFEVATMFAGGEITIPELGYMDMNMPDQGVVIKLNAVPQAVVCNLRSLDDYLEEVEEELESFNVAYNEDEVLIDSAKAHIDSIDMDNLVAVVYDQKVYKDKNIQNFFSGILLQALQEEEGKKEKEEEEEEVKSFIKTFKNFFLKYGISKFFLNTHIPLTSSNYRPLYFENNEIWEKAQKTSLKDMILQLKQIKVALPYITQMVLTPDTLYVFFRDYADYKSLYGWKTDKNQFENYFKNKYLEI
jgi:hypothetical protein